MEYIFRGMSLRRFKEYPYPVQQFSYLRLNRNIGHEDFNHFEKFLALVSCSDLQCDPKKLLSELLDFAFLLPVGCSL